MAIEDNVKSKIRLRTSPRKHENALAEVQEHGVLTRQHGDEISSEILTEEHEDEGTAHHEYGLHEVGPHDGRQPAGDAEDGGDGEQDEDGEVQPL